MLVKYSLLGTHSLQAAAGAASHTCAESQPPSTTLVTYSLLGTTELVLVLVTYSLLGTIELVLV